MSDIRRYEVRRATHMFVELISQHWDEPVEMITTDISPAGIFLPSDLLLEAGEPVVACFDLPGHDCEFQLFGEVVWAAQPRRWSDFGLAGMGIQFVKTLPIERLSIRQSLWGFPPPLPYKGFATHTTECETTFDWGSQEKLFIDETQPIS